MRTSGKEDSLRGRLRYCQTSFGSSPANMPDTLHTYNMNAIESRHAGNDTWHDEGNAAACALYCAARDAAAGSCGARQLPGSWPVGAGRPSLQKLLPGQPGGVP